MNDINSIVLIGRLTKDADIAYTPGGTARLNLSLAVNRSIKQGDKWQDKASFFEITVWGKTAENIGKFATKGKQLAVTGYLDQQRWEKDGKNYSKIAIIAESVQLLGGNTNSNSAPQPAQNYVPAGNEFPDEIPWN